VLALKAFHEHDCAPGRAAKLDIEVKNPSVTHSVAAGKIDQWLDGGGPKPQRSAGDGLLHNGASKTPAHTMWRARPLTVN
jgi:hypothetical protein